MGKMKKLMENQKTSVKEVFFRYLFTLLAVEILCILEVVLDATNYRYGKNDPIEYILAFLVVFAASAFCVESLFGGSRKDSESKKVLIFSYISAAALSLIFAVLGMNINEITNDLGSVIFYKILGFYFFLVFGVGLYKIIKDSGLEFHKYLVQLIFGLIRVSLVFLALNIGMFMILGLFDSLIMELDWDWFFYTEILLTGFVYVPYALICITNKKELNSKFVRGFLLYALMPMVLMATAIIYLYMIRLIFGEIPSNEIFGFCAWLFAICAPIWTMAYAFLMDAEKLGIYGKIIKYMKYIYAPFLLLEIYSIGARIGQWGITEPRYFAVVFIFVQIIYILWEPLSTLWRKIRKKEKWNYGGHYENIILIMIFIAFFVLFAPALNFTRLSFLSQKARFEENYEAVHGAKQDDVHTWKSLNGAYRFLKYDVYGSEYLEEEYTEQEINDMLAQMDQHNVFTSYENWEYVSNIHYTSDIDIAGYSRLYPFSHSESQGEKSLEAYRSIEIPYADSQKTLTVDLSETLVQLYEMKQDQVEDKPMVEVVVDDHYKLVLRDIDFSYNPVSGVYKGLYLSGYILER